MAKIANWDKYTEKTNSIPWLKQHRDWVEKNNHGFGDRPLHYMWYKILRKLGVGSTLLEIGVYKGQVISLWGLISRHLQKNFRVYGVTPLISTTDQYHQFEDLDYRQAISDIHDEFLLPQPTIIQGLSQDVSNQAPAELDLLFIDGGHDRGQVESDINLYVPKVKKGGIVVFDDASCNVQTADHWYKGLQDVSDVVDDFALDHDEFLRVGHNRCFYAN